MKNEDRFTDDELETIRHLIIDWGFEYSLVANREKVKTLAIKLGMTEYPKDQQGVAQWQSTRFGGEMLQV